MSGAPTPAPTIESRLAMALADAVIEHGRETGHDAAFLLIVAEHITARVILDLIPPGAREIIRQSVAANVAAIVALHAPRHN